MFGWSWLYAPLHAWKALDDLNSHIYRWQWGLCIPFWFEDQLFLCCEAEQRTIYHDELHLWGISWSSIEIVWLKYESYDLMISINEVIKQLLAKRWCSNETLLYKPKPSAWKQLLFTGGKFGKSFSCLHFKHIQQVGEQFNWNRKNPFLFHSTFKLSYHVTHHDISRWSVKYFGCGCGCGYECGWRVVSFVANSLQSWSWSKTLSWNQLNGFQFVTN